MKNFLSFIFIIFLFSFHANSKIASVSTDHADIELLVETKEIKINEDFVVGIKFNIEPGWHVYWKNPGDSGLPATVDWQNINSVKFKNFLWPPPEKTPEEPLMTYGYYNELVLPAIFSVGSNFTDEGASQFDIDFLICEKICIPESVSIEFDLSNYSDEDVQLSRDILSSWYNKLPKSFDKEAFIQASNNFISIEWEDEKNEISEVYFYPEDKGLIKYASNQELYKKDGSAILIIERPQRYSNDLQNISGVLEIHTNRNKESFEIKQSINYVQSIEIPNISNLSFWVAIILAFFGGIILNIMP